MYVCVCVCREIYNAAVVAENRVVQSRVEVENFITNRKIKWRIQVSMADGFNFFIDYE